MSYSAFSGLNSGNAGIKRNVRQSNDFRIGDAVRLNGSTYVKAQADSSVNAEVVGVVETRNSESFTVVYGGEVNLGDSWWGTPTPGQTYFLDNATAGKLVDTPPLTTGTVKKTVLIGTEGGKGIIVNYLGLLNGFEGGNQVSLEGVSPVGQIVPFAGDITNTGMIPRGWLLCNGGQFSSVDYPELATLLGDTYGTRQGLLYRLPDLRGRTVIGVNNETAAMEQNTALTTRVLGANAGVEEVALSANEMPSHVHVVQYQAYVDEMANDANVINTIDGEGTAYGPCAGVDPPSTNLTHTSSSTAMGNAGPVISNDWCNWCTQGCGDDYDYGLMMRDNNVQPAGGGNAHDNMPPYLTTNYLIRADSKVNAAILTVSLDSLTDVDNTKEYKDRSGAVLQWAEASDGVAPHDAEAGDGKFILNPTHDPDRNLIINGNFDLFQRGFSKTITNNTQNYVADRFAYVQTAIGASGNIIRNTNMESPLAHPFASGLTSTPGTQCLVYRNTTAATEFNASDYAQIQYLVEGYDLARVWSGNYITLSFWVYAKTSGKYCVAFKNAGNTRSFVSEYTVENGSTWEYKTIEVPMDSSNPTSWEFTNGTGLRIAWVLAAGGNWETSDTDTWIGGNAIKTANQTNALAESSGTSANFAICQVQLESGRIATPLQTNGIEGELKRAERYFEKSYDLNSPPKTADDDGNIYADDWVVSNTAHIQCQFRTRKRIQPTVTIYNPYNGNTNNVYMLHRQSGTSTHWSVSSTQQSETGIHKIVRGSGSWASGYKNKMAFHYTASAELT